MEHTIFLIGAVAWWSTALVHKDGPGDILLKFREWTFKVFGRQRYEDDVLKYKERSPLVCVFCTGFWVLIPLAILSYVAPYIVQFFGILGIAAAVRGMSNEYGG